MMMMMIIIIMWTPAMSFCLMDIIGYTVLAMRDRVWMLRTFMTSAVPRDQCGLCLLVPCAFWYQHVHSMVMETSIVIWICIETGYYCK